ncbi:alpha beta-hydrolase [Coniophora puteana RWD-64-598 SS2]|uniref:Alpha beta-hydrolase n=1 Tax=Coniophora puteana (strain RWD-64-598) TaxID=741705 RepID=A0A5M3M9Q7_CONPW|nr:alpha beta-hydrolase [Coniophora puteana RWD-64-598 SS2]EIW75395.1 alpha beta-hydrolase [Coniophora puteana RWD-64-598 SS2]
MPGRVHTFNTSQARHSLGPRSIWGPPCASKKALILHGLAGSSQTMARVAEQLALEGKQPPRYFVSVPELPGHGISPRFDSYCFADMIQIVSDHLIETTYDLVIGFSLGAILALAAIRNIPLSYKSLKVVAIEPPIKLASEIHQYFGGMLSAAAKNPPTPEFYMRMFPRWSREDATLKVLADELCDPLVVDSLLNEGAPWNFTRYLIDIPSHVRVLVIGGDLSCGGTLRIEDLETYPDIDEIHTVEGASHYVPIEFPEKVVDLSLEFCASRSALTCAAVASERVHPALV